MSARIIICGAGQVGFNIARYLSHYDADVICIDNQQSIITNISESLDIKGVCGYATHPDVLERAGARNADLLIAVTEYDEVNIVACEIASSLFNVKTKIARIRDQAYLKEEWQNLFSKENLCVDVVISPEMEVARSISHSLEVPNASSIFNLADGKVQVVGVKCTMQTPVVNTPLGHFASLFPDIDIAVMNITRQDQNIIPTDEEILRNGDEIHFCCAREKVHLAMQAFVQRNDQSNHVIILGGGNIGLSLAQIIETEYPHLSIRIIELEKERADFVALKLEKTIVLCGDALDVNILKEANVHAAGLVLAVTADDRVNALACLLAKKYGALRAQCLINNQSFGSLIPSLGIDSMINPRAITVSRILEYVRKGSVQAVYSIRESFGEIIEAVIDENSPMIGSTISEIEVPHQLKVGAIYRNGSVIISKEDLTIQSNDHVILMVASSMISRVEKMISERINPVG